MPPSPPVPNNQLYIGQVSMMGLAAAGGSTDRKIESVFHFRRTSNVNVLSETVLETAFNTSIAAPLLALLNVRYMQTNTDVRFIEDATRIAVTVPRTGPGTVTGDAMPMENYAFVLARVGVRGKAYRGAKKIGPLSESDTTSGSSDILNAAAVTRFNTFMAAWQAGVTDANGNVWVPCMWSRTYSQFMQNPTIITTADITQVLLNQRVSTLKKRKVNSVY